ncbi:MAG: inorganic phosphate transporter [Halovenus sp.]
MAAWLLLAVGIAVSCFVAYNIGGATTGPAFAPAVGAGIISKVLAAAFMSVFFFVGAVTIGRRVVDTLGQELVADPAIFTLTASIIVLFYIGGALFIGNTFGVPASTSMTAVGAIAGLGLATGELNWAVMGEIVSWWLVAPIIGFWVAAIVGRYFYVYIDDWIAINQTEGALVAFDRSNVVPRPTAGPNTTSRELVGSIVVVLIGCVMAFSSGTSNIANAIAPLVGSGQIEMNVGIAFGSVAVAVGAFTIGRRTMETLGNDITNLPLTAAIVVALISSLIVILLSGAGIPASFVVVATMSIVGLGWGRATRTTTLAESVESKEAPQPSVGGLAAEDTATVGDPTLEDGGEPDPIGAEEPEEIPDASDLFKPSTTARVIIIQNVVPIVATVGSFVTFQLLFLLT